MKAFYSKKKYELWAFLIPFLALVLICIGNGIYPIGNRSMLHVDMYHQYCPFFADFAEKLKHGDSLLYTWNLGLGSDYISLYAYYLASPFNWLLVLCPKSLVIEFMEIQIILKLSLAGLFMWKFLYYHNDRLNSIKKALLVFSTAYALSGFVAAYSWDIMWLDTVALAPLVLLGIEKLVKENKIALYVISLAISIWANYYISIMLCIFVLFYFGWMLFAEIKGAKAKLISAIRFGYCSLLAGGMSAVLILPEIAVLNYSGSSMGKGFPETMQWYFNILGELSRLSAFSDVNTTTVAYWPNLYCGVFAVILVILYAFNRRISLKKKIPAYLMVALFVASFANNYLDFIWHGLHFPESLPGRQSYLFALLLLMMASTAWKERSVYRLWHLLVAMGLGVAVFIGSMFFREPQITSEICCIVSALLVLLYVLTYLLHNRIITKIMFFVALGEIMLNMALTGIGTTNRDDYTKHNAAFEDLLSVAKEQANGDFYRVEDVERLTKNDSSYHGYSSATIFSSLMNIDVSHFYQSVYMEGGKNFYCFNGATPLTSAFLSVDYVISKDKIAESPYQTLVAQSGNLNLYKNTHSLSVGFVVDSAVAKYWDNAYPTSADRISNMNELATLLGTEGEYISQVASEKEIMKGKSKITIPSDGYYYASYQHNSNSDKLTISSSEGYRRSYSKAKHRYLLELGQCKEGEVITISNTQEDEISFSLYRINEEEFETAYQALSESQLQVSSYTSNRIDGTINCKKAGKLVFSIPYVPGWTLFVDGNEVETTAFADAFISADVAAGNHEISLRYQTPNLVLGGVVSALCIIAFLLLLIARRFLYGKENKHSDSVL